MPRARSRCFRNMLSCALLPALCAHAATPWEGELPIELARYFTGGGVWYADLPPDFPALVLPAEVQVLGSLDQTQRQQVILTTTGDRFEAQELLAATLDAQEGWLRMDTSDAPPQRGFVAEGTRSRAARVPASLCHDELGSLQINGAYLEGVIHVNYAAFPRRVPGDSCQRLLDTTRMMTNPADPGLWQYLPALEVPRAGMRPGNRGVQADRMGEPQSPIIETSIVINDPDASPEDIDSMFAGQLRDQDWSRNERWNGTQSAGSHWTFTTASGEPVALVLAVVKLADADFDVSLKLYAVDE